MNEEENIINNPPVAPKGKTGLNFSSDELKQISKNASSQGFGTTSGAKVNLGFNLATDNDYLKGGENYQNYFGSSNVEDIRANNQSGLSIAAAGTGRVITRALSEIAKIPGFVGGAVAAPFAAEGEGWETFVNNKFINAIGDIQEQINADLLPVYTSEAYRTGNITDKIFSPEFWATDGADGIGFIASMLAPGAALKALSIGSKVVGGTSKAIGAVTDVLGATEKGSGAYRAARALSKLGITKGRVDQGAITIANSMLESGSEANSAMRGFEQKKPEFLDNYMTPRLEALEQRFLSGQIDQNTFDAESARIQQSAEQAFTEQRGRLGRDMFVTNMGILLGPNALQTKILFGGASKFNPSMVKPSWYKSAGKGLATGIVSEGLFEEGMQTTVEEMFSHSALKNELTGKYLNDFNAGEVIDNYVNTLNSTEGQSAIILGALLGGGMNAFGSVKSDNNDYVKTLALNTQLGSLISESVENFSVYQKDDTGNIVTDENGKPKLNTTSAISVGNSTIAMNALNGMFENSTVDKNLTLANFVRDTVSSNIALNFASADPVSGKEAMNHYLESQREAIQSNENLTPTSRNTLLNELSKTEDGLNKYFDKIVNHSNAYSVIEDNILPQAATRENFNSDQEHDQFLRNHKIGFLKNRLHLDILNNVISNKQKDLKVLHEALGVTETLSENTQGTDNMMTIDSIPVQKQNESEVTLKMQHELGELEYAKQQIQNEFVNKFNNPDSLMSEIIELNEYSKQINHKKALEKKLTDSLEQIKNAKTNSELNEITLPDPALQEEFTAAVQKRKSELHQIQNQVKVNIGEINSLIEPEIQLPYENLAPLQFEGNESEELGVSEPFEGYDENMLVEMGAYQNENGDWIIDNEDNFNFGYALPVNEYTDNSTIVDDEAIAPESENIDGLNVSTNEPLNESNPEKDIISETETSVENDQLTLFDDSPDANTMKDSSDSTSIQPSQESKKNKLLTDEVETNLENIESIPDDPQEGFDYSENFNTFEISENKKGNFQVNVLTSQGVETSFVIKYPRLVSYSATPKAIEYVNKPINKRNHNYNVNVRPLTGPLKQQYLNQQKAYDAYEKLKRIQSNSNSTENITEEDIREMILNLPLTAKLGATDIVFNLDGATMNNNTVVDGEQSFVTKGAAFLNSIPMRIQIVNSLIQNVNAPIKLSYAKQFTGFLNVNRNSEGKSILSNINELSPLMDLSEAQKVEYFKDNFFYADIEGRLKDLQGNNTSIQQAPGSLWLQVNKLNGDTAMIKLSRRKFEEVSIDDSLPMSEMLTGMIEDVISKGLNAFDLTIDNYLETLSEDDRLEFLNKFDDTISLVRKYGYNKGYNSTVNDLLNFYVHTSANSVTKLSLQNNYIIFGTLAQKTSLADYMDSNGRIFYDAFMNEENADNIRNGMQQYLQMLKHNVKLDYFRDNNYINYMINNILASDIKPFESVFTTNLNTFKKDGTPDKANIDNDIYVNHVINSPTNPMLQFSPSVLEGLPRDVQGAAKVINFEFKPTNTVDVLEPTRIQNEETLREENITPKQLPEVIVQTNNQTVEFDTTNPNETIDEFISNTQGQMTLDLFNDETIEGLTEDELVEKFTERLNNLQEEQIIELNEELSKATAISEYEPGASNTLPSTTESSENISGTSETIEEDTKSIEKYENVYSSLDEDGQIDLVIDVLTLTNQKVSDSLYDSIEDAEFRNNLFNQSVKDIIDSEKNINELNKICNFN